MDSSMRDRKMRGERKVSSLGTGRAVSEELGRPLTAGPLHRLRATEATSTSLGCARGIGRVRIAPCIALPNGSTFGSRRR